MVETEKKSMFCRIKGFESKTTDDNGNLIKSGYIATTHLDSGWYDPTTDRWIRDRIAKETLYKWADEINSGIPRANKLSVNHNRQPHVAGLMLKGSAKVVELPDGEFGLYVDTVVDKTREDYDEIKYRLENGFLDSFSIEYNTRNPDTGEYLEDAVSIIETESGAIRTLLPNTILEGATYASQPMNEHAIMIKELNKKKEMKTMVETNTKSTKEITENKEEEIKKEEVTNEEKVENQSQDKGDEKMSEKENNVKVEAKELSAEDMALLREAKEKKELEAKERYISDVKSKVVEELKEILKKENVEEKTKINKEVESKEIKSYNSVLEVKGKLQNDGSVRYEIPVAEQFKIAANLAESKGLFKGDIKTHKDIFERKYNVSGGRVIEYKSLGIDTNSSSYTLSSAELNDIFDPIIYNGLNEKTTTWNILDKLDYSNKGNNKVQFTVKTTANSTAAWYTGNSVSLGNTGREKYETKFKKAQVGVEVDGDMIAAAVGGPVGDVFAQEIADATSTLLSVFNQALFAEKGAETDAEPIGFPYITDSAGNTVLYGITRSGDSHLAPSNAADTYINGDGNLIGPALLRQAKRQAVSEGAMIDNLVFITSYEQGDAFRGLYDAAQRMVPTSSRFGFEGRPEFDGIPIFEDKDCPSDSWFLVDLETCKVAMWVPPTLEMLGKDGDSVKGFVKSYWAFFSRAPNRMVQIYGLATS